MIRFKTFILLALTFTMSYSPVLATNYIYQDVVDYANSSACYESTAGALGCCLPSRNVESSSYYETCYNTVLPCTCTITANADEGYTVKQRMMAWSKNWKDSRLAVSTTASARTLCAAGSSCATTPWKKANCDWSPVLDTNMGAGQYYCTSAQYNSPYNYGRRCDGLYHPDGQGDCNGGCPSRINDWF